MNLLFGSYRVLIVKLPLPSNVLYLDSESFENETDNMMWQHISYLIDTLKKDWQRPLSIVYLSASARASVSRRKGFASYVSMKRFVSWVLFMWMDQTFQLFALVALMVRVKFNWRMCTKMSHRMAKEWTKNRKATPSWNNKPNRRWIQENAVKLSFTVQNATDCRKQSKHSINLLYN